jgi:hypothetical protein
MGKWRIRITGSQRKNVDTELLIQAVIALGEQLSDEAQQLAPDDERGDSEEPLGGGS